MYAEVGESSSDTATVTITYGDTSAKQYNILVRQIACDAEWRYRVSKNGRPYLKMGKGFLQADQDILADFHSREVTLTFAAQYLGLKARHMLVSMALRSRLKYLTRKSLLSYTYCIAKFLKCF